MSATDNRTRAGSGALYQWRRLVADRGGAVVVIFAVALPVMLGALGLGIELGMWYLEKRRIQEAADTGALQGAFALRANSAFTESDLTDAATVAAGLSGYGSASIDAKNPPTKGNFITDTSAVQVTVDVAHPTYFINVFGIKSIPIEARAVATQGGSPTDACILALGNFCTTTSPKNPLTIIGNATLDLTDCGIHANGKCPNAMDLSGSSITGATCITGEGQVNYGNYCGEPDGVLAGCGSGSAYVNEPCGAPHTTGSPIDDPFEDLHVPPTPASCSNSLAALEPEDGLLTRFARLIEQVFLVPTARAAKGGGGPITISPGCFNINSPVNDEVHLNPGVYYFKGGIKFHGPITGTDVILIVVDPAGDIDINANNGVNISAPEPSTIIASDGTVNPLFADVAGDLNDSGGAAWGNMLIYNNTAGSSSCSTINGNSVNTFVGAIYMPEACMTFNGDASVASNHNCLMVVADELSFSGNVGMSTAGCGADSNLFQGATTVGLVE